MCGGHVVVSAVSAHFVDDSLGLTVEATEVVENLLLLAEKRLRGLVLVEMTFNRELAAETPGTVCRRVILDRVVNRVEKLVTDVRFGEQAVAVSASRTEHRD